MSERWVRLTRAAAALLGVAALFWLWRTFGAQALHAYDLWRYPAIRSKPVLGDTLKRSVDDVRRAELKGMFERVKAALDQASADGLRVAPLYEKLPQAARMIKAGQFDYARVYLSSIEARIPKKAERIVPAGIEVDPDEEPAPPPKPARRTRSGRRR